MTLYSVFVSKMKESKEGCQSSANISKCIQDIRSCLIELDFQRAQLMSGFKEDLAIKDRIIVSMLEMTEIRYESLKQLNAF